MLVWMEDARREPPPAVDVFCLRALREVDAPVAFDVTFDRVPMRVSPIREGAAPRVHAKAVEIGEDDNKHLVELRLGRLGASCLHHIRWRRGRLRNGLRASREDGVPRNHVLVVGWKGNLRRWRLSHLVRSSSGCHVAMIAKRVNKGCGESTLEPKPCGGRPPQPKPRPALTSRSLSQNGYGLVLVLVLVLVRVLVRELVLVLVLVVVLVLY